ncbi:MAG: hypothetical protein JO304_04015 [Solirubrobacterales bacterium]|nr:hypothetical protein [Solirubrobacterales bacterium]
MPEPDPPATSGAEVVAGAAGWVVVAAGWVVVVAGWVVFVPFAAGGVAVVVDGCEWLLVACPRAAVREEEVPERAGEFSELPLPSAATTTIKTAMLARARSTGARIGRRREGR